MGHLSSNPLLGRLYHEQRGIRRLIFQKRYNIYYTLREDTVFVLFIFDGRMCLSPLELCHYFGFTGGMMDGSEAVFG